MLELYDVRLEKFCAQDRTDLTIRYEYDLKSGKTARCLKVGTEFFDINTLEQYHMLQRSNGITLDQSEVLELNKYYAVSATQCSKSVYEGFKSLLAKSELDKMAKVNTKLPQKR